jgi:arginine utilization regulatory protein
MWASGSRHGWRYMWTGKGRTVSIAASLQDSVDLADPWLLRVARRPFEPVLIAGRKSLEAARRLHSLTHGVRRAPCVVVDCAWLPSLGAGPLLFGYDWGQDGFVDQANGGTLVFENAEFLGRNEQAAMVDLVDHGGYRRARGLTRAPVSLRLVATTRADPEELVRAGRLRPRFARRLEVVLL